MSAATTRRRRWRWWWLLPLLLLGVPGLLAWWLLDPTVVLALLRQAVHENVALELETGQPVELVVFPAPRLALREVRLTDLQAQELARIEGIDVELPWNSLWQRPPTLGRISLREVDLQAGPALDQWLAQWDTGPASPSLSWPRLERGLAIRRLRYHDATVASDEASATPVTPETTPATPEPLFELAHLELEPLRSGGPLQLDLAVIASGLRLGLIVDGRAEDANGNLRVAAATIELAAGPVDGNDEAVRGTGQLDLSYLPSGAWRGDLKLELADGQWLAQQAGLDLAGPWQLDLQLSGEDPYQTLLQATAKGEGLDATIAWPIGSEQQPRIEADIQTRDGLRIEGLQLQREAPESVPPAAGAQ